MISKSISLRRENRQLAERLAAVLPPFSPSVGEAVKTALENWRCWLVELDRHPEWRTLETITPLSFSDRKPDPPFQRRPSELLATFSAGFDTPDGLRCWPEYFIIAAARSFAKGGDSAVRDFAADFESIIKEFHADCLEPEFNLDSDFITPMSERLAILEEVCVTAASGNWDTVEEIGRKIARIALTKTPVLLLGETGTGKGYYAEKIHKKSLRKGKFIPVNCGTIEKSLFNSTLFGHKRGAFTGAISDNPGRVKEADGGTLFLDELGDLSEDCQAGLLRFVETGEISPVGGKGVERVENTRVLAATNRPEKVRHDLLYRFSCRLCLPPLRVRSDIATRINEFFLGAKAEAGEGKKSLRFPNAEQEKLVAQRYQWPGHVRQLKAAIELAVLYHTGDRDLQAEEVLKQARQSETGTKSGSVGM